MSSFSISQPDVTLLMDMEGVIRNVSFSSALAEKSVDGWLGRRWGETVAGSEHDAVRRMIADAQTTGVSAFSQVMQRFPSGRELPVEYTTLMLGGKAGLIAIGKNLQAVADLQSKLVVAQQTMERDYWKLREVETRYRLLFEASDEAVLLVREPNLRIMEANPAAIQALGLELLGAESVVGRELIADLDDKDLQDLQALLGRTREQGRVPGIAVRLGPDRRSWLVRASLVMSEPGSVFLLQLTPARRQAADTAKASPATISNGLMERMPNGFAVVDRDGVVLGANMAFLDLVEASSKSLVVGQKLGQWLREPGADWIALSENIEKHGSVRLFQTTISSEFGTDRKVEICGTGDVDAGPRKFALLIQDVGRRHAGDAQERTAATTRHIIDQRLGKEPLKNIVDEAVGSLERECIRAALLRCTGNRKAAAEMLGLSRQTLYAKLSRYGLEQGLPSGADDEV